MDTVAQVVAALEHLYAQGDALAYRRLDGHVSGPGYAWQPASERCRCGDPFVAVRPAPECLSPAGGDPQFTRYLAFRKGRAKQPVQLPAEGGPPEYCGGGRTQPDGQPQ